MCMGISSGLEISVFFLHFTVITMKTTFICPIFFPFSCCHRGLAKDSRCCRILYLHGQQIKPEKSKKKIKMLCGIPDLVRKKNRAKKQEPRMKRRKAGVKVVSKRASGKQLKEADFVWFLSCNSFIFYMLQDGKCLILGGEKKKKRTGFIYENEGGSDAILVVVMV